MATNYARFVACRRPERVTDRNAKGPPVAAVLKRVWCPRAAGEWGNQMNDTATGLAAFDGKKYLNLETYRKAGTGVRTPVWFAASPKGADPPKLYVYSTADSGKAKRIRRTAAVRIAPCDMRGNPTGAWIDARAEIVSGEEAAHAMRLLDRKYWPWKQVLGLVARLSPGHERVVFAIRVA